MIICDFTLYLDNSDVGKTFDADLTCLRIFSCLLERFLFQINVCVQQKNKLTRTLVIQLSFLLKIYFD